MKRNILVLFGPPGIGKGTVGKALSEKLNLPLISAGDLLRSEVKENSDIGKKASAFMKAGSLVPDELVFEALKKRIASSDAKEGFLLDGFPRNLAQADLLDCVLDSQDHYLVLNLTGSDTVLIERLSQRRICASCGAIYHLVNMPPRSEGVCDTCGGLLIQRNDDSPDVIAHRLEIFRKETEPVIGRYQKAGTLRTVKADATLSETMAQIAEIVGGN